MLFARGHWAVFGVKKDSLRAFEEGLAGDTLATLSQSNASTTGKKDALPTKGINPFLFPRLDEAEVPRRIEPEDLALPVAGSFAFWVVLNDYEDVTDPASKKESIAYKDAGRPFKFLSKEEKKLVEQTVTNSAVMSRKQFPVLVDFNSERVYVASSNVDQVMAVRDILTELSAEVYSIAWDFGGYDWVSRFLSKVRDGNKFESEMTTRAEELQRFRPEEVEKLEDSVMEKIVSNFFALSELETGMWAGLSTPSRIKMYHSTDPASVGNVSTAFNLLSLTEESEVASCSVVFQNLDSRYSKKEDAEKQFRTDVLTLDLNDNINMTDAGAAMLRGFDLPQFKRDTKAAIKGGANLEIADYWLRWLSGMKTASNIFIDNVTETLALDKQAFGLVAFESAETESVEV